MADERQRWFLREWRQDRGYTLERLAEMIGTSKGYVGDLEAGKRRYNQDLLERLAEALRCEPADLIRRAPADPAAIETKGLEPDQVSLLTGMAEQMRRTGSDG